MSGGVTLDQRVPARAGRRLVQRRRALTVAAVGLLLVGGSTARWLGRLDDTLATRKPSHVLLDRRGRFLGEVPGEREGFGFWPLPTQLPERVVVTTLETEDRHFHEHDGVAWTSVARAAWQNVRNGRIISGASTIAMQVARLQHPRARTIAAKLSEAVTARRLIARYGHDAVLRQYLTLAPYGNRTHGIVRAARLYFDKPIEDLSWLQAAYLAALPQQPSRMSPWTTEGHARALARARRILKELHRRGHLDDEALRVALTSDLSLSRHPARPAEALHAVLALSRDLPGNGVIHRTTLDLDVQRQTHQALVDNLRRLTPLGAGNTAGLVVELPGGEVRAYVGSADYFDAERKGAIDYLTTRRSPGSSLKPFIYAMALEQGGHTAATELPDTPVEFPTANGGLYVPENMTHTFMGPMLLRQALRNSRNIPALRVLSDLGVARVVRRLEQGGVRNVTYDPDAYGLTLAMGSLHVTARELAQLYTALANRGVTTPLRFWEEPAPTPGARLVSEDAALLTAHMLADPEARRPAFPPGGSLDFDGAVAVKTGTSQGFRDAWAAAFSDRLLVVGWVGNHDWRRMNGVSGATGAAPAVHAIVDVVGPEVRPWQPAPLAMPLPHGALSVDVCALSGRLPGPRCPHLKTEHFVRGTEPAMPCPFHAEVPIDSRTGLLAGPSCPKEVVVTKPMLKLPEVYAPWARKQRLAIAPTAESPLCPTSDPLVRTVRIREPAPAARFLFDPDTPRELATLRLSAAVQPATEEVVWLVDGTPVARVGYPHEARWSLTPGTHVIRAVLAGGREASAPVRITVDD
ncbi:MAG: penicillin-binding protein 1C [Myxococcaceae bacterium]|nr:penicillin-binding protein 1C [Myxococcaceae bacterium]